MLASVLDMPSLHTPTQLKGYSLLTLDTRAVGPEGFGPLLTAVIGKLLLHLAKLVT